VVKKKKKPEGKSHGQAKKNRNPEHGCNLSTTPKKDLAADM